MGHIPKVSLIGLTGGIATGKTVVEEYLKMAYDLPVLDADRTVHYLLTRDRDTIETIVNHFGADILNDRGVIDRQRLARRVFKDPSARRQLETIIHPRVIRLTRHIIETLKQAGAPLVFVSAPLMIEAGTYRYYPLLVVIHCSTETQLKRLIENRGMSPEEARARIKAQLPNDVKRKYADFLIDTEGSLEETLWQVVAMMHVLWPGHPANGLAPENFKPILARYRKNTQPRNM